MLGNHNSSRNYNAQKNNKSSINDSNLSNNIAQ